MKRVIVAGGRNYEADERFARLLGNFIGSSDVLISGMASRGADREAVFWARNLGILVEEYPADWQRHSLAAGPIRNREMAQQADVLVAFWDGKSKGTRNMIDEALRAGLETHVFRYGSPG